MLTIKNRQELIAYKLAEHVVCRQTPVIRRVTVKVWAEVNELELSDEEIDYALAHWHDYVIVEF